LGFLVAVFPFMQFFATPILGQLSDRYGRKKLLWFSLFGTFVARLIFIIGIVTKNIPLLFLSRALDGITGGNISVAQAAIADVTTQENRAKNFGLIGAAFGLGFILGPYFGGKLSDSSIVSWFSVTTPFIFSALLSFINLILVIAFFPETLKLKETVEIKWNKALTNISKAFALKDLRILFLTTFLVSASFTFYNTFFSVYLINKFHFSQGNIGDYFSYIGIWIAFVQMVVVRKIANKYPDHTIIQTSLFGMAVCIALLFLPREGWQLFLITPFFAIFNGLNQAYLPGLISKIVNPKVQGEILGINTSLMALAQTIPPVLSGFIAVLLTPSTPIIVSSIIMAIAGIIFIKMYNPKEQKIIFEKVSY
jgi:MFS transporter, DHA1 family, tetracycline resistance protein